MITKKELQECAHLKGLSLGNAEKEYLIDMALLSISNHTKNELVFKGGTCLYKFHRLDRFSEDLDFSAITEINVKRLINSIIVDFEKFGIRVKNYRQKEPYQSLLVTLRIEGPLFTGKTQSYANLGIDINMKSQVYVEPEILSYTPIYQEIPTIHALCMRKEEIFAEKVRAIMTRDKARDVYDLWFLVQKGIKADADLIEKKLEYYKMHFQQEAFTNAIRQKNKIWHNELKPLLRTVPSFTAVRQAISSATERR